MTDEEMIENLKCVIADISEQCEQLKSKNAALRERLEKAVKLPFVPTDYHIEGWLAEMKQSVTDESVTIVVPIYAYLKCDNREAAEARLAELNRRINIEVKKLD